MTRLLSSIPLLLASLLVVAWSSLALVSYTFESTPNEMSVEGGSTLHDWSCPIESIEGSLQLDTAQTDDSVPLSGIGSVQVRVPVDAIQCDKETMNEKLREALQMNAYPEVYFNLDKAQIKSLPEANDGWVGVNATGELILAGERRQIELPVKAQRQANDAFRFVGEHTILLSDYDIDRPSAMFGTIKTSKEVTVKFDVTATPETK